MVPTYIDAAYNPPSPIGGYVRALVFTLILAVVGAIAFTVFQGSPQGQAATISPQDNGGTYTATQGEPAAVDAQPISN